MVNIHQIISAVNPLLYYNTSNDKYAAKKELEEFKGVINKEGIQKAAEGAKPKPLEQHTLIYDSSSETLEPVYFFILDLMNDFHLSPEKLVDNFTSSPGSGHFGDLGQRATIMQQQASRILGDINNVMKSILNLVYDLKEFKIRLQTYDDLKSPKKEVQESALLALKQIWIDKVDINKGNSSIKAMAFGQGGFQTLLDAFFFVKDESLKGPNGKEVDLNDRVKRVLKQRIHEFNLWLSESEKELRKRYEMERKYLKSQVNSIKLYSRWAKPYMKSALQLEMKDDSKNPALVKTFNSILLELTLLGKSKLDLESAVEREELPKEFAKMKLKRNYYSCVVVDFNFRGVPKKVSPYQQHYMFGGRAEITFSAYALNDDELKIVKKELEKADIGDAFKLIEDSTTGSLEEMESEIDMFLREEEETEKKTEQKIQRDSSNPFLALLGFYNPKPESKPSEKVSEVDEAVKSDNYLEKRYLRPLVSKTAKETAFNLFDIYKKAHGMPSYT